MSVDFKFEELKVYQKALDFVDVVYQVTKLFPKSETYGLSSQFQRAAQSIALNIAEGSGGSKPEFIRYLRISRSSLMECVVCITIAKRQNYLDQKTETQLRSILIEISKMLSGLIRSIKQTTQIS
ncbi:MAG: four helix bundle protein [Bacteroidetes bacterium]|nr:MAG: four helix bundle protein [Bacteroidota bacterium]